MGVKMGVKLGVKLGVIDLWSRTSVFLIADSAVHEGSEFFRYAQGTPSTFTSFFNSTSGAS